MATLSLKSNLKYITSGNEPTTTNLPAGNMAVGLVGSKPCLYSNLGGTIYKLNKDAPIYIVGTQTSATGTWKGSTDEIDSLYDGLCINYYLPYNGSGSATLTLTLKNSTTSKVPIYFKDTTRVNTQYTAGSMIGLAYHNNSWHVISPYTDNNDYDRVRFNNAIKAKTLIEHYYIIGANDDTGFFHIQSGSIIDIEYPILRASSTVESGSTGSNNYIMMPSTSLRYNKPDITLTQYKSAYIVGTLSGTKFTVDSAIFANAPTSKDGKYYIPIGFLYSTYEIYFNCSQVLVYAYGDDGFRLVSSGSSSSGGITPQQLTTQEISYVDSASESTSKVKLAEGEVSVTYDAADPSESANVEINKVEGKIKLYKMSETLVDINGQGSSEPYIKLGGTGSLGCFLNIDASKISSSIWGNARTLNFPSSSGTLALTSDIPEGFKTITSSHIRIWDLAEGSYKWSYSGDKYIYYMGATSTSAYLVSGSSSNYLGTIYLYVMNFQYNGGSNKAWYILAPNLMRNDYTPSTGEYICLLYGKTGSTGGYATYTDLSASKIGRIPDNGLDGYEFIGTGSSSSNKNQWRSPIHYLICTASATATTKSVTCTGFRLVTGVMARVKMTQNHTSSSAAVLNISSTGAKTMRWNGSSKDIKSANNNSWNAGELLTLVYDGTYWEIIARSSDMNVDAKIQAAITGTLTTGY